MLSRLRGKIFERFGKSYWIADFDDAVAQNGRLEAAAVVQRIEYRGQLGNLDQVGARLEQANAAHAHSAHGEFTVQQLDQRHAPRNDVAPGLLGDRFDAEFLGSQPQHLILYQTHSLVRPIDRIPRVAKEPVAFQTAICKRAHFGKWNHLSLGLGSDEDVSDTAVPYPARGLVTAPQFDGYFLRHRPNCLGHKFLPKRHRPLSYSVAGASTTGFYDRNGIIPPRRQRTACLRSAARFCLPRTKQLMACHPDVRAFLRRPASGP